ncbi:MAG TPA: hypothetical protein VFX16_07530 [Pseudonocardiaceae bacterium]|nr:hypothetical protein [Pseudonocardiaceae bacterium]
MARLGRRPRHGFGDDGTLPPPPDVRLSNNGRRRKPPGKLAIAWTVLWTLVLFGVSVGWFVTSAVTLPYRAGWAGTPGVASSVRCAAVGTDEDKSVDCFASFTSADGATFVPYVGIEGHTDFRDADHAARLHPDGRTISVVDARTVLFTLAAMAGALVPIVLLGSLGYFSSSNFVRRRLGMPMRPAKRRLKVTLLVATVAGMSALGLVIAGAVVGG